MSYTFVGFHASHEQFAPSRLVRLCVDAEAAGFAGAMCSDHFLPWSDRQGESGFAWAWLGSAMQATSFSHGSVCAPVHRYHPAIVAQAFATLAEMHPGRVWVAFGSGEHLNERIVGGDWPTKKRRNERLKEAVEIIRELWRGETVDLEGRYFRVVEAKLHTLPDEPPLLLGAAITSRTAAWMAPWVDGLITVSQPDARHGAVLEAFRAAGGEGKPAYLQAKHSFADTEAAAIEGAYEQWRTNVLGSEVVGNLATVEEFEEAAKLVRPEDVARAVRVSSDPDSHAAWLAADLELGFDRVYVHNVNREQERFIEVFGEHVLPSLT